MKRCHSCGCVWESTKRQPAVKEFCEGCGAYLHCCLNCRFHDPAKHNQCAIPNTDWVADKEGANFCDEFEFREAPAANGEPAAQAEARNRLDSLFGEREADPADSEDAFRKLFGEDA
jgi:hypothetical protein